MKKYVSIILFAVVVSSCGLSNNVTRESQYSNMYKELPVTILVMPPINNTTNVDAKELLYTSISRPLAEAGFYVISPQLSLEIFKEESAYDAEVFIDKPLTTFHEFFGADAVIFSQIDDWTKRGFGIETKIRYIIKSTISNEILFDRSCDLYLSLQQNSGGSSWLSQLVDVAVSVINTVATDHIVAARKANYFIFRDIPRGKYSPEYLKDKNIVAEKKDIKATVK